MIRIKSRTTPVLVALVLVIFSAACGSSSGSSGVAKPLPRITAPVIKSFEANPNRIQRGDESALVWSIEGERVSVNVAPVGREVSGTSLAVAPVVSTTYTLTVSNAAGSSTARTVVRVVKANPNSTPMDQDMQNPDVPAADGEWVPVANNLAGQPTECGNLSFVSAHPSRDMVIAGVARNGLWASMDGADDWVKLGSVGGAQIVNRTTGIIFDPADPDTWWESGIYSGPGAFRTTNNGATFDALGDVSHSDMLSIDLGDPTRRTMLSGTHERAEVLRSRDGGATWEDISAGLPSNIGFTESHHVIDENTYLVGTKPSWNAAASVGAGVYRTDDGGLTWDRVFDAGVIGRPLDVGDETLHWLVAGGLGMITSTDNGATWSFSSSDGPTAEPAISLIELPNGILASTAYDFVITSADNGVTWRKVGPRLPFEARGIAYAPFRNAFYAWTNDCTAEVRSDSIVRLDLASPPE